MACEVPCVIHALVCQNILMRAIFTSHQPSFDEHLVPVPRSEDTANVHEKSVRILQVFQKNSDLQKKNFFIVASFIDRGFDACALRP